MRLFHWTVAVTCVCLLTGGLFAQPMDKPTGGPTAPTTGAPTAVPKPPARPVIDLIPADSMGFVVVNNISGSAAAAEKFLSATGISDMVGLPAEPGWLVAMLKGQAKLADGFNSSGGFAVVMLDPDQFGVDLPAMMGLKAAPPSDGPPPKLPVVLLVPGSSIAGVFGNYEIQPGEKFDTVNLRMGPMLAVQMGGYIALSPSSKALQAVQNAKTSVAAGLSAAHIAEIAASDLCLHLNMKVAGPIIVNTMRDFAKSAATTRPAGGAKKMISPAQIASLYDALYGDLILQTDSVTATVRFDKTGLVISERVALDPASEWGQALAAYSPAGGKLLDKLPNLPYVLAYGASWQGGSQKIQDLASKMLNNMFALGMFSGMSPETKTQWGDLANRLSGQETGFQVVLGGAPADNGLVAASMLLQFKDSSKAKALITEVTGLYEKLINSMMPQTRPNADKEQNKQRKLQISYVADAENISGLPVDAIDIKFSELETMSELDRTRMKTLLGEDRLRIRLAAINDKDVLMTFGGSQAMFTAAVQATKTGGGILSGEATAEAMTHMPARPIALMLFNGANLVDLIGKAAAALKPDSPPLPFKINARNPIAAGAAISGSEIYGTLYVPNALVADAIKAANAAMAPPASTRPKPATAPE